MNGLHLINRLWHALPLSDRLRCRIASIVLFPLIPFIRNGILHHAYLREKAWQENCIRPFDGDAFPLLPRQTLPDVLLWGVIDWHHRIQRPQHLARGFAQHGHRVFYISTQFANSSTAGFELEQLNEAGFLFNVRMHLGGRPKLHSAWRDEQTCQLQQDIFALLKWLGSESITCVVQHPFWYHAASKIPDSRLIYDCLDHHGGFGKTSDEIAALELTLFEKSDVVVTTSQWLHEIASNHNDNVVMVRNATEFNFFSAEPATVFHDAQGRRILGYYGAIAHWLDVELLVKIARQFPDCLLLLVGADECGARKHLSALPNVQFTGEAKYSELPYYLHSMSICLLPFRVMPLTLATNPVKIYEYLSAGKAVVATSLPELVQFDGLVDTAETHDEFIALIADALRREDDRNTVSIRRSFAAKHTWEVRTKRYLEILSSQNMVQSDDASI